MSKEEGEITDDDECGVFSADEYGVRNVRRGQLRHVDRRGISHLENIALQKRGLSLSSRHRDQSSVRKYEAKSSRDPRQKFNPDFVQPDDETSQMFLTAQSRGDYSSSSQTPYTKSRSSRETDGYNNYRICKDRHNQQQFRISTYPTPNSTKSWRQRKFYPSHPASDASQQNNDLRSNRSSFLPEGEQNNADNRYELLLKKYQRVKQQLATYENEGTTTPVPQQHSQVAHIKNRDGSTGFTTLIECTREGSVGQGASDISSADDTCLSNWTGSDHRNENESIPNIAVGASTNLSTKAAVACAETVVDNSASVFEMKVESGESSAEGVVDLDETITGVATSLLIVKDSPSEIDITNQFFKQPAPDPATTVETPEAEEEEDLDELELRRIALESAARRMAFDDDSDVAAASSPSTYTIQAEDAMACQSEKKDDNLSTSLSCESASQTRSLAPQVSADFVSDKKVGQFSDNALSCRMSRSSSGRASSGRQAESEKMSDREKSFTRENTSRKRLARHKGSLGSTLAREKSLPPRRTRPLPFAPTRLDRITVKPSRGEMERSSEHEVNVKRRARQVSVVRRLHRSPKTNTTDKQSMQLPTQHQKSKGDKDREEKRRQEIAKILSLEDPKEQVQRFLRFLNVTIAENSQSKQQLRDNYEEVEMDIDSGDEVTDGFDIYGLPSALQPLQLMGADAAEFQCTMDLLQGVGQWQIPYPLMDSYSGMISFPTILPSASRNPPISSMPLQVLPPVTPAQPPLPEDLPQPPPPPPPDSEGLRDSADWMNSYSSSVGFANKIDTRATFMKDEIKYQSDQVPCRHTVAPLDADGFEEPPSQKGSSPGLAEDSLKPEAKFGADDEEEIELRKQLLEDLIKRKGQAENKKSESGGSSPATFDAQSPHHTLPTRPRDMPRKVHKAYLLPMHKPVVVPLCDSSSEEEDSEKDCALQSVPGNKSDITDFDIDRFLKLQRKTVEEQKIGSLIKDQDAKSATTLPGKQIRLQHLKQKETDLAKLRHLIIEDQDVITKGRKIMAEQKKAENVVVQLQQQLMAAQKLVLSKRPLVLRAKMQIQEAHVRLLKNQEMYRRVEEKTLSLGQQLLGADYRPQMAIPLVRSKRKVEVTGKHQVISITVLGKDTKKRKLEDKLGKTNEKENIVTSTTVAASCSPDKRTAEKARLQKLAKEYEEKIRHLKMLQMQRKQSGLASGTSNTKHQKPLTKQVTDSVTSGDSRSTRLPSLESIKLEPVESDTVVHKLRRRSLLDISQSPKPNLLLKEHKSAKKPEVASDANTQSPVGKKKLGTAKFKMPFGFQLQNLCKIQKEKVTKILSSQSYSSPEVFSNLSPHCDPIPELKIISLQEQKRQEKGDPAGLAFTSPLLYFKAYRFSPYYRTKENLTIPSVSYSNKLNPNRILCRYELQGICNDQQCPWQHARDYRFSEKELLQDLVAYCPKLAGVTDGDEQASVAKKIDSYVEGLLAQHKGKMTFDDICLLLTSKVNECAQHVRPHTMFFESRVWRPTTEETRTFSMTVSSEFQTSLNIISETASKLCVPEMDTVLDSEDVRYFVPETVTGADVQDMEGAVLATPTDTDLWLRLAYSKLSNPSRSREENLNLALNVLARGLESNKDCVDLWTYYLTLYRCHGDSSTDYLDLCNTALEYAPCYEIWWQLLEASSGFQAKDTVCIRALNFLCRDVDGELSLSDSKDEVQSHQMLEMILYKVTLNSQSGRFKTALNFFQSVAGVRESTHGEERYRQSLTHADICVLWICLVHLMEFQTLPAALYDPSNQNPGRIMSKKGLWIPWHSKRDPTTPFDTLVLYLSQAVTPVESPPLPHLTSPQYVQAALNLTQLLCYRNKYIEACETLRRVLEWAPHLEDLWLMAADIYAGSDDMDSARQVLVDSVASNSYSAKLHYNLALLELLQDCADEALELMERFVISHFNVSDEEMTKVDPNYLFCKILGLDVPVMKKLPPLRDEVKEKQSGTDVHLWLCYCLLLELQGETSEAVDVFEHALSSTIDAADLCLVWKCYVQFLYRRLHSCPPSLAPATLQQLQEAMLRSVTTAPTLLPAPYWRRQRCKQPLWRDFSHVNALVDFYIMLVAPDTQATALQTFLDLMPSNVLLLIRCIEVAIKDEQRRRARSLCTTAVYDRVANLQLWKLALSLAQEEGTPQEVERLFVRAVRAMPLSVTLWKDFLLYEVSQENSTAVQNILTQCQGLGLNIQGYVATISSSAS